MAEETAPGSTPVTRPVGIVLAGGTSRRMGQDKALAIVDGRRLIDRAVAFLEPLTSGVLVASGQRTIPDLEVPQIADCLPGGGPLGGILAGLQAGNSTHAIVLAVDIPRPDAGLLQALSESWAGQPAIVPSGAGRPQPLHAVWSTAVGGKVAAAVADGTRSVIDVARQIGAVVLSEGETELFTRSTAWALNLNTPGDLESFEEGRGGPGGGPGEGP
ncbi:molybdenum cofactor guanylyltransferase [Euzebya tangerina]|uniref:molybdenum cofactor guanylyltransferase n=1 Tax=Euzebya tangerina TaxID=591198 RepID=UPI000E322575|nr:molybdenum cofactor guanylyltransferase [Euzebya tangerina]